MTLAMHGGNPVVPEGAHRLWPAVTQAEDDAIARVNHSGQMWGPYAPEVAAMEEAYAAYVGRAHCLMVNSGTAAIHCALVAAGIGPGDEVITAAVGFVATPMAILHSGAVPVFVDVDPRTFNLAEEQIEQAITTRTAGILVAHMHGTMADMPRIGEIAERRHLDVIEDISQAHGASLRGEKAGTFGQNGAGSVNPSKNLSSGGEGGLFFTDKADELRTARRLAIFGEDTPPLGPHEVRAFWSTGVGWNYRSQEWNAAFCRSQLTRLDEYNGRAARNARILTAALENLPGFVPPYVPEESVSVFHLYRVRLVAEELGWEGDPVELRDRIVHALTAEGVPGSTWQHRVLPDQPVFRRRLGPEPWSVRVAGARLAPRTGGAFPVGEGLVRESFVLGASPWPLHVQHAATMERYADAFRKVSEHMSQVLTGPYKPLREVPEIPAHEL